MDVFDITIIEHLKLVEEFKTKKDIVLKIANLLKHKIENGNKILICGNGGSASDSQHFAAELVGRFQKERKPLPAIALTTDTSILTSVSNDYSFNDIFVRQVEAVGKKGDVLVGFSTSGNSKNVISAFKKAKEMEISTIAICGNGGELEKIADITFKIPSKTSRVQEIHAILIHILCEIIES